jgi:hypothetical protein
MGSAQYVWEVSRALLCDEDGLVVMLRVCMDESGTHAGSPVITVGAAWAKPSVWKQWTKDWNLAKRPIRVHHSTDCHNREGEYAGWCREERDAYVKRILPVIAGHKIHGRIAGLHLLSYKREIKRRPDVAAFFGNPYIVCFHWIISDICNVARDLGSTRVAFLHENNDYEHDALAAFRIVESRFPKMKLTIGFTGKDGYVPLQCADVIAFEGNRRLRDTSAPTRKPMEVIDPSGDRIGFIEYDDRNMPEFVSSMCFLYDEWRASGRIVEGPARGPSQTLRRSRRRQASERSP